MVEILLIWQCLENYPIQTSKSAKNGSLSTKQRFYGMKTIMYITPSREPHIHIYKNLVVLVYLETSHVGAIILQVLKDSLMEAESLNAIRS